MKKFIFFLLGLCTLVSSDLRAQVLINEYSASNLRVFQDNYQKTEDWVELHNTSASSVNLEGWRLSDKVNKPAKWIIPAGVTIPANGFIRIWCSGRDEVSLTNYHSNFKLSQTKAGEVLMLSQPDSTVVDQIPLALTLMEHSRCRATDGGNDWMVCTSPTLSQSNNAAPKYIGYTNTPTISLEGGFYNGTQTVSIQNNEPNSVLHYTLDGSAPVVTSPTYTGPISISSTQVLKAKSFSNDNNILPGKIDFQTYFIDESFSLAVFSVAADEIINLANGQGALLPIGSLEYFNENQERVANSYGELNRHGQDSWVLDHRSLDWISRDEMGYSRTVEAPLFSYSERDEYQRFMFRASGDDNYPAIDDGQHEGSTHVRDEYVHALAMEGNMKLDVRAVERVIVFLNGQYWGVYGLRERPVDHDYTKEYYDQGKFDLQYLSTWGNTEAEYGGQQAFDDWGTLRDFILNNDMSDPDNYQSVKDQLQLVSLIDYMIANLNSVASDWLNYNTGWWRGRDPEGDHKKWGYILWDNDATFDYYINYSGVPNINPDAEPCDIDDIADFMDGFFFNTDVGQHEKIFLKLQEENPDFKQLYYSRQADLMNTVYSCDNMLETLDRMIGVIAPEMPRQIQRWGGTMQEWEENVATLRGFIEQRCTLLDDGMTNCFDVTGPYPLTLQVEPVGVGEIDLNTLEIEDFPWTGNYFGNMKNLIKAKATDDDYKFSHWISKSGNPIAPEITARKADILLAGSDTLIAVFIPVTVNTQTVTTNFGLNVFPTLAKDFINIKYSLDQSLPVNFSLHSVLGNKVVQLTRESNQRTTGTHTENFDLSSLDLGAGIYFLQANFGTQQASVKVVILE
ncbi:MAG: CotH kinase family protein [Saprospiraceae bacterium]